MLILLMLILVLITYLVTHHYDRKRLIELQQKLNGEFQLHIQQREQEHQENVNVINSRYNTRLQKHTDAFYEKYVKLQKELDQLVKEGRKDAIKRSRQVVSGQVYEQISPLVPGFPYDLKDVRHVGNPLDFLVFSGLYDSSKELEIIFLEIKSGSSALNNNERLVRNAIQAGRVRYEIFHPDAAQNLEVELQASVVTPLRSKSEPLISGAYELDVGSTTIKSETLPPSAALIAPNPPIELFKCEHCKRSFEWPVGSIEKPLFCPQCRGS